jgi:transcriptional regulator with XRE-family HTH domain
MANKRTTKMTFSEQLHQAIESSGMSRYQISKGSGVEQSALSRFVSGQRGLTTSALDKLADFLDLRLTMAGKPIEKKGR